MNSFDIRLGLEDSKGTDLKQWIAVRSFDAERVELVLVSLAVKPKGERTERSLGFLHTANFAGVLSAVLVLTGGREV